MKRFITSIVAAATIIVASAMSYSQAREQAWFLTDKMAYELYLSNAQISAVYEINLDYIMSVDVMGDIFGKYWDRRTRELGYVLTNSQMHAFLAMTHFYRPITWVNNSFYFSIYDRYPRTRFYSTAPKVYTTYRGEHRNSTTSRFEGKFDDVKTTTGRTVTNRTGVTTTTKDTGFTNPGNGTINNGRTRPSGGTTTTVTRSGGGSKLNDNKVTPTATSTGSTRTGATVTSSEKLSNNTATMGSVRSSSSSRSTSTSGNSASTTARRH